MVSTGFNETSPDKKWHSAISVSRPKHNAHLHQRGIVHYRRKIRRQLNITSFNSWNHRWWLYSTNPAKGIN
jgi:hypothetical protein